MKMKKHLAVLIGMLMLIFVAVIAHLPTSALRTVADDPKPEITEVSSFEQLLAAVNADKTNIKLTTHIMDQVPDDELPTKHRLAFDGGEEYTLDLGGYILCVSNTENIFYTDNFSMIGVSNGSKLEIKNGAVDFENYYADSRTCKGLISVEDTATLVVENVRMRNYIIGPVVYAKDNADVTLDGGDYTVQNGFAVYMEGQASLTLDGGVYLHTVVGDSMITVFQPGYGALYSESTGALVINNASFKSGIQIHSTQLGALSVATHEVVINGKQITEDIFDGTHFEAQQQNKEYYWYDWVTKALNKTDGAGFSNTVRVISYEKKYPIEVVNGTAMIDGNPVTEAYYQQEITIVADTAEEGMEFVRWGTAGVGVEDSYSATTTFPMSPMPVKLEAFYGKLKVASISASVAELVPGEKAYDTEITLEDGVVLDSCEWYENDRKMDEDGVFKPGKTYKAAILVYPPEDNMFANTVTATINGKSTVVSTSSMGHAVFTCVFEMIPSVGFDVFYDFDSKLGIGGNVTIDTDFMAAQSAEFNTALAAGEVSYQWYKNGVAVEGETEAVYEFTAEDAEGRFYASVTVNGKTNYGYIVECGGNLYKLYLTATEIIPTGKAPMILSGTPGVSIDAESLFIAEIFEQNSYGQALDIAKATLTPGKSYRLGGSIATQEDVDVSAGASVYVNGELMTATLDESGRFFYDFSVAEADYPVYYKANGETGIGVTLSVDIDKMRNESSTFDHACEAANSTYKTVFYQWYKNGEPINNATDSAYTVTTKDRDSYIHCKVTLVDGKYGAGEQVIISNVITVINFKMPTPKNGATRITTSQISADGVNVIGIIWTPQETGAEMQGNDTYVEGQVYEFYVQIQAKETFLLDFNGDMTIGYAYGEELISAGSVPNSAKAFYMGEVVATHVHQYSDTVWDFDEDGHWQPCIVPGCANPNEEWEGYMFHYGGGATCQTKGACAVCGHEYYAEHDTDVPDYEYIDNLKCGTYCATEGCDYLSSWSYHTGGVATCTSKAICEICYEEYGEVLEHAGGTATCSSKAICTACGEEYGALSTEHSFGEWISNGDGTHTRVCKFNNEHTETEACTGGNATCSEKAVCSTCNTAYGATLPHNHASEWSQDENNHWKECACGDKVNVEAHEDTDNNGKCDACDCDVPTTPNGGGDTSETPDGGSDTPDQPEKDKDGLGAGAIAGIVIGSVVVVGVGGFALVWFVFKKKTWADFVAIFKK